MGSIQEVMVHEVHYRKNSVTGRTRGNHSVHINDSSALAGDLLSVRITGALHNSLEAEIISTSTVLS